KASVRLSSVPRSAFRLPRLLVGALHLLLLPPPAGAQQPDSIPTDTLAPVVVTGVRLPTVRELARGLAGRTASLDAQDLDARGVRPFGAAGPQRARRRGEPPDPAWHEPGGARNRSVGGELGTLRAEGARRHTSRRVGLLPRGALRAGGRLARGYPQPDRHAVRQ